MSSENSFAAARALRLFCFSLCQESGPLPDQPRADRGRDRPGRPIRSSSAMSPTGLTALTHPKLDQICIDDHADPWTCGIEARDQLTKLIGAGNVRCDDVGPDKNFRQDAHRAICTAEGDKVSLNQQLRQPGLCLERKPIKAQRHDEAAEAKDASAGLWKGCFVAPQEFRLGKKDGTLLGAACRSDRDTRNPRSAVSRRPDDAAQLQPSRASSRCAHASPAISASIICRAARATPQRPSRTAGSAPKTTRRPAGFRKAYQLPSAKQQAPSRFGREEPYDPEKCIGGFCI